MLPIAFLTYCPWPFEHTAHDLSRIRQQETFVVDQGLGLEAEVHGAGKHLRCRLHKFILLGGLVGTQRKKAEHAMFENHFERRASSTKRVRNAKAKTCAEDHTTPF